MPEETLRVDGLRRVVRCWGKTGPSPDQFHPALYHMLDVAHVAQQLLAGRTSGRWRLTLERTLGIDGSAVSSWVPWILSLHDIGKISAAFQMSKAEQLQRLKTEGYSFGHWNTGANLYHATVGQVFVADNLSSVMQTEASEAVVRLCWEMIAGHHGRYGTLEEQRCARKRLRQEEALEWGVLRVAAASELTQRLLLLPLDLPSPANVSAAIMALTGFAILCDWLGSDERHFPPQPGSNLDEYVKLSQARAWSAVDAAGFAQPSKSDSPATFASLFPSIASPRPLQKAVDSIPSVVLQGPCLAIIEAPTGEGKTEAALTLAHRLAQASGTDELYYALPTTATSNQMHQRVERHLRDGLRLSGKVRLVHGQAFLVQDDAAIRPPEDDDEDRKATLEWFAPKKRALLAPFGVGTIDQAELAVLNVKHTALRMLGLAGKVIILDEVHAYDMYMTTIVERLLNWLSELGTSVILLSATLPKERRERLAEAYGVTLDASEIHSADYPCLWVVGRHGSYFASPPAFQPDRRLELHWLHLSDAQVKAQWLLEAVARGGCACWITNTVRRAQDLFEEVDRLAPPGVDRSLLHAQFPLDERQMKETALAEKYGPEPCSRPRRGIVIGTQVLEQSLDLDFDVMVSDLAPVDLLLQRAGRLQRHSRRQRPTAHLRPHFWINCELNQKDDPNLRIDSRIYAEYFLMQTWAALSNREEICLPRDYRPLVEAVYGGAPPQEEGVLAHAWYSLLKENSNAGGEAMLRLLPPPDPEDPFCASAAKMQFHEEEGSTRWIVAMTRLGEDSVTVIPLERNGDRACNGSIEVDTQTPASRQMQLALLRRSLRVSRPEVVEWLRAVEQDLPGLFSESPLLRNTFPLWLVEGQTRVPTGKGALLLRLDARLGLVIRKEGE